MTTKQTGQTQTKQTAATAMRKREHVVYSSSNPPAGLGESVGAAPSSSISDSGLLLPERRPGFGVTIGGAGSFSCSSVTVTGATSNSLPVGGLIFFGCQSSSKRNSHIKDRIKTKTSKTSKKKAKRRQDQCEFVRNHRRKLCCWLLDTRCTAVAAYR